MQVAAIQKFITFVNRYKWSIGGTFLVGGTAYYIHKLLRYIPVREVLVMIVESEDRNNHEINSVLRGAERARILTVSSICS